MKLSILIIGIIGVFLLVQTASAYSLKAHAIIANHIAIGDPGVNDNFQSNIAPGSTNAEIAKSKAWMVSNRAVNNPGIKRTSMAEAAVSVQARKSGSVIYLGRIERSIPENSIDRMSGKITLSNKNSNMTGALKKGTVKFFNERSIPENSIERNNALHINQSNRAVVKFVIRSTSEKSIEKSISVHGNNVDTLNNLIR